MTDFQVHTLESAPERSRPLMERLQGTLGMLPNLAATFSESPEAIGAFAAVREVLSGGTFTPAESQVLTLTNATMNGTSYCAALHATFALKLGVAPESVAAIRAGRAPKEPKLAALVAFSRALIEARGKVSPAQLDAFLSAGHTKAQALEVIATLALSTVANYAEHLTHPPVEELFRPQV